MYVSRSRFYDEYWTIFVEILIRKYYICSVLNKHFTFAIKYLLSCINAKVIVIVKRT